jgi:hypothetical protein
MCHEELRAKIIIELNKMADEINKHLNEDNCKYMREDEINEIFNKIIENGYKKMRSFGVPALVSNMLTRNVPFLLLSIQPHLKKREYTDPPIKKEDREMIEEIMAGLQWIIIDYFAENTALKEENENAKFTKE